MEFPFSQIQTGIQKLPRNDGTLQPVTLIRLGAALLLMLAACLIDMLPVFKTLLLILSVLVAGYDILLDLVDVVLKLDFFTAPVVLVLIILLSFLIGRGWEAALCVILYQLGLVLLGFCSRKTRQSAQEMPQDKDLQDRVSVVLNTDGADGTELGKTLQNAASPILKVMLALALLFGILMPIVTSLSVKESISRALILLVLSLPLSVVSALPLPGVVGLGYSACFGALFGNARVLEKLQSIKTVVIDKSGIFADSQPQFIGVKSEILDEDTFMEFVAHAAYYSDQPFAKAILASQDREFRLDLISDFQDIPGSGIDLKIGGNSVTLAKRELLAERGEAVPYEGKEENSVYYLMVAGKYIGKVLLAENLNKSNANLISKLKEAGVQRCVLLTEDSRNDSERLGLSLDADEVYSEFTDDTKLQYLETLDSKETMYLYANSLEKHSNAAVDLRASKKGKYADALVNPDALEQFPVCFAISRRMKEITAENAVFAFVIKAILLFLGVTGNCTLWFALFLEIAAALAAAINAIRVTKKPLVELKP